MEQPIETGCEEPTGQTFTATAAFPRLDDLAAGTPQFHHARDQFRRVLEVAVQQDCRVSVVAHPIQTCRNRRLFAEIAREAQISGEWLLGAETGEGLARAV